jgi:hypothetical protein
MKLSDQYRGIACTIVGTRDIVLLWADVWNGHHLMTQFSRLHSFARNNKISIAQYLANPDIHHSFHTPISSEATQELTTLNQIMMNIFGDLKSTPPADFILLALLLLRLLHLSSGYGNQ